MNSILNKLIALIKRRIMSCLKLYSREYVLVKDPDERYNIIFHISDETWDTAYTPEIYKISKERTLVTRIPKFDIYIIHGAEVNMLSDIVVEGTYALWDKYNDEEFRTLACPTDYNLVSFTNNTIRVMKALSTEYISGRVLNLTGTSSNIWSHFLFQYVCKLFFAGEAGLLDEDITLLVNDYKDQNIDCILNNYLSKYPKVHKKVVRSRVDYVCDKLIYIRATRTNINGALDYRDYRQVIPQIVINKLNEYICTPLTEKCKNNPENHKKIFLTRRVYNNRGLVNNNEVEKYFKELGFYFVEGYELTLDEKVDLFYHAEVIVGVHSSAWANLIFCNKDVRCLMLANNRYITEIFAYTLAKQHVSYWLNVCGQDTSSEKRSNFYIPLSKIQAAYQQLIEY
jgi:hypothetical protein